MKINIVRSARRSISICISAENNITVRCPTRMSKASIDKFLESKKLWIERIVQNNEIKLAENRAVLVYREIYVCGQRLPLIISDRNQIENGCVRVKSVKSVKNTFIKYLSESFIRKFEDISAYTGLKATLAGFKSYKARWGCCDAQKRIIFNYLIFCLPLSLQRYIIIHELCHTVYLNHSKKFWRLVAVYEPEYKQMRQQLKRFDFITNLY